MHHPKGVGLLLQEHVAGESRLFAALTVIDYLIAVLGDLIQTPLVDLVGGDAIAKAVPGVEQEIVIYPDWVIGPCWFK